MNNKLFKLSPSDFAFLYEGCKRCFYIKVVYGIPQPSIQLPGIFSRIASLLKNHYSGQRTEKLHKDLPLGVVSYGEKWVTSQPIALPGRNAACYIKGRFDIVCEFDDGTYGVIDFKTSNPREEHPALYGRQLHAYAYALENPAEGALNLSPVNKLGLLYFHPQKTLQREHEIEKLLYEADIHWVDIPKDHDSFLKFVNEMMNILELPAPPEAAGNCAWCNYRKNLVELGKYLKAETSERTSPQHP